MSTQPTNVQPFKYTKAYRKAYDGKFKKLRRLARMMRRYAVKSFKAAQKRSTQ